MPPCLKTSHKYYIYMLHSSWTKYCIISFSFFKFFFPLFLSIWDLSSRLNKYVRFKFLTLIQFININFLAVNIQIWARRILLSLGGPMTNEFLLVKIYAEDSDVCHKRNIIETRMMVFVTRTKHKESTVEILHEINEVEDKNIRCFFMCS